ncbi:MAG: sodium-dependent transporter [Alphaproteobacteria bacterium]
MQRSTVHETWSSRFTFVMAAVGSAVGLGNFWRFPYEAGQNGGAAFVIVYLVAVFFIALPVLMSEYVIGRRTGLSSIGAYEALAKEAGYSPLWKVAGWVGMIAAFLIVTFYSMIAGWVMAYVPIFFSGDIDGISYAQAEAKFGELVSNPSWVLGWHTAFMGLTAFVVARGLRGGIEVAANVLMPAFFIMLLGMVLYAAIVGNLGAAIQFLFTPDFSKLSVQMFIEAIGQAFFSVGVGSAIMITYGAYLTREEKIASSAITVVGADTCVALLAGLAIFPLVFAVPSLEANGGPGLLFQTLPAAIGQLPGGSYVGGIFFTLAFFAALTSAISLFEPVVAWSEDKLGLHRPEASLRWGIVAWGVGIGSVLSTSVWSDFYPLNFGPFTEKTFFDVLDILTSNFLLPISGIVVSVFTGWVISEKVMRDELELSEPLFRAWQVMVRYVIPLVIGTLLILLNF